MDEPLIELAKLNYVQDHKTTAETQSKPRFRRELSLLTRSIYPDSLPSLVAAYVALWSLWIGPLLICDQPFTHTSARPRV
jgi:hypothetical protein